MSLLLNHSLDEAVALMRGELSDPTSVSAFPITSLGVWRLAGIEPAPGTTSFDSDEAWKSVVSGWWSIGATWGLMLTGDRESVSWNLVLPLQMPAVVNALHAHVPGTRLKQQGDFFHHTGPLTRLPFRAAMTGHPGCGENARLETAIRSMAGREFALLFLARSVQTSEIHDEIRRCGVEEQFVRDEHLSRPGLEHDNHASAARYLALVTAARDRAMAALLEGGWQARTVVAADSEQDLRQIQSLLHAAYGSEGGQPEPLRWQEVAQPRGITFLRSSELAALTRLPRKELPGLVIETNGRINVKTGEQEISLFGTSAPPQGIDPSICVGRILADDGLPGPWLETSTGDLCRHLLVAGMTGSGKTTTCEHILLELWREHRIPWLVIEPGMNPSYRRLLNSEISGDLRVFALANPDEDSLPMNPLAAPSGIGLAEHISGLFAVLTSAFELVPPMPEVLATAIEETYRVHGWNPAGRVPDAPAPSLQMLIKVLDRHTRTLGYGAEITGNLRSGLLLRLDRLARGPLAAELGAIVPFDAQDLLSSPCIIELSALPDAHTQALVLGLLAQQLRHHWRLAGRSNTLRHVTLIEEAHRLLRAVPSTEANATRSRAVEDVANMLAELRGMGAGLIIVDQTPSALVPSVIANTGTKILHRLDHPDDRELAGRAAGLPASHVDLLGRLRPGEAILRSDRRPRPFRVHLPNPAVTYGSLPMPTLPKNPRAECRPSEESATACGICGASSCLALLAAEDAERLIGRLVRLREMLPQGEDALWAWAGEELTAAGIADYELSAPLCFLMSLGRGAHLPPATLQRLRAMFAARVSQTPNH